MYKLTNGKLKRLTDNEIIEIEGKQVGNPTLLPKETLNTLGWYEIEIVYPQEWLDLIEGMDEDSDPLNYHLEQQSLEVVDDKIVRTYIMVENPIMVESMEDLIAVAKKDCESRILSGFYSDCTGEVKHYDCSDRDQLNITDLKDAAQLVLAGMDLPEGVVLTYKATGELECTEMTPEQCVALWVAKAMHIKAQTDQFNEDRLAIIESYE